MNPEIMLSSGRVLDLFDPDPEVLDIQVIARALARLCRYNGHSKRFYSVAEHSVLVSSILPKDLKKWGLLHDAAEAFLGDVVSPLKRSPLMAGYRQAEAVMEKEILRRFGVYTRYPEDAAWVKRADLAALATEIQTVAPGSPEAAYWRRHNETLPAPVVPSWELGLAPEEAEDMFLEMFAELP